MRTDNNTIQVPIAIAANICDVSVIALASDIRDEGETDCTALSTSTAEATVTPGTGGASSQDGLVNVILTNNTDPDSNRGGREHLRRRCRASGD